MISSLVIFLTTKEMELSATYSGSEILGLCLIVAAMRNQIRHFLISSRMKLHLRIISFFRMLLVRMQGLLLMSILKVLDPKKLLELVQLPKLVLRQCMSYIYSEKRILKSNRQEKVQHLSNQKKKASLISLYKTLKRVLKRLIWYPIKKEKG